jgi:hypothetical protein
MKKKKPATSSHMSLCLAEKLQEDSTKSIEAAMIRQIVPEGMDEQKASNAFVGLLSY